MKKWADILFKTRMTFWESLTWKGKPEEKNLARYKYKIHEYELNYFLTSNQRNSRLLKIFQIIAKTAITLKQKIFQKCLS